MGICGRAVRSSAPVAPIDRMVDAVQFDARGQQVRPCVDGARLAACDTASASKSAGRFVALFDGRLDNRAALLAALNLATSSDYSPADLVLRAFLKWRERFCTHIFGDFACAVWDAQSRQLVLATDPSGMRPLFYRASDESILFASDQRGILADPATRIAIDEDQLVSWLTLLPPDGDRTFFAGVHRVPPGGIVTWRGAHIDVDRWWRPELLPLLKLASDADYEAALREGIGQAVRYRLGDDAAIGSNLSGGLDSSAVTAVAARELAETGRRLFAFTAAPATPAVSLSGPGWIADEWEHAAAVASLHPNITHVRVPNDATEMMAAVAQREAAQDWPLFNPINAIWVGAIEREARDRGLRVLLVGALGNYSISHHGRAAFGSQLRRGRLGAAWRNAQAIHRNDARSWRSLVREAALETLPALLVARLGRSDRGTYRLDDYSAINPAFLHDSGFEAQARAVSGHLANMVGRDSRALRLLGFRRSDHLGIQFAAARRLHGVDVRDPTSDRQLLELCLSIPDERFSSGGIPRNLIRRAMRGLVPDIVRNERRRGQQSADWVQIFDRAVPDLRAEVALLRDSPLASRALDLDRIAMLLDGWDEARTSGDEKARYATYRLAVARGVATGSFIRHVESLAAQRSEAAARPAQP